MALALRGKGQKSNYPYAVARVQAKRSKLIPAREYEKIVKMDVSEITRFIEESEYKRDVDELASRFRGLDLLEAALVVNQERTLQSVRRMLDGEGGAIVARYLDRYIIHDLKTILRGKAAAVSREELLREMLLEDMETFGIFQPLLAEDVKTTEDCIDALERHGGKGKEWARILRGVPQGAGLSAYEDALDKAYYAGVLASLEGSSQKGAKEVRDFLRLEVDALNLQNAARWVAAGQAEDFTAFIIPGGKAIRVGDIVNLAKSKDLAAFAEQLKDMSVPAVVREGLDAAVAAGRLAPFQAAIRRALAADLDRLAHANPLSIVPILVFLVRKHWEVVTLRAVARGRAAGLSEERLKELIA